jgi:shikimate kinase
MGAGKSTIGRRLAKAIGRDFVDSDDEIEQSAACSISDIFAIHGETIFRDLEKRVIYRLLEQPDMVLATGGGAWMQPHIREKIKEQALSLWLHADLDVLVERVEKRNHRPLLEKGDKREILQQLIDQRYPVYAEADLKVETSDESHDSVIERVIETLNTYGDVPHVA